MFFPDKQGLYNPEFEHDSCGVGFIADVKGRKSQDIIKSGIEILKNLAHRGATGSDPKTGDGAGITIQLPDPLFRKECARLDIDLPPEGDYGAGLVFLPPLPGDRHIIESIFEHVTNEEGQKFLGFRDVPHNPDKIGSVARSVMPELKHV